MRNQKLDPTDRIVWAPAVGVLAGPLLRHSEEAYLSE